MEYRIGTGEKILYLLIAAGAAAGGIYLLVNTLQSWAPFRSADAFKLLGVIALGAAAAMLYREVTLLRLTIDESARRVEIVRFGSTREFLLDDVEGFRKGEKNSFNVYLKSGGKAVEIPTALGRRDELLEWFGEHYTDLDAVERDAETEVLLKNEEFGVTEEDRAILLAGAKRWEAGAAVAGFGLFFWALVYPNPYGTVILILFIVPWIAAFVTWKYRGLMKLYKKKNSPYPSVVFAMVFPSLAALLRMMLDYDLYGFPSRAVMLVGGATLAVTLVSIGICWKSIVNEEKKAAICACFLGVAVIYSFAVITFANCYHDNSKPQDWKVQVMSKRINSGKTTSYYFKLTAWGMYSDGKEVQIGKSLYNRVSEKDSIHVYVQKGKLDLPWYWVSD